ncbi:MAG: phosphonate ABC transporter, permease protein PhnE, partial [Roseibium sp.]|uniref:PhnE/PtxC family ABC transporter permease n=1 Tax=Roseibium sp. TaxID=1936156 RepID=UPI00345C6182|nr:phosphonate ABC transporter, permease protein PhnE [Roseibium sp.]
MSAVRDHWRKQPFIANPVLRYGLYAAIAIYGVTTLATLPIDWDRAAQGLTRAGKIFGGAFPPSFERSGLLIDGFLESLKIAILATVGGIVLSIPIAFMAARNIAPLPIYYLGRAVIIIARSFHPVIVAIVFVKAVGFGPFAGI